MVASIMGGVGGQSVGTSNGSSSSSNTSGTNFSAGGESALATLLAQLLGGGTPEQLQEQAKRQQEISNVQGIRADYSKPAAFADATGAMNQQARLALEKLIPSITRAADGAGTSQSSMRALLLQDAANKSAESAAALGLKASVDYGGIATGLSNTLATLTQQNNPITKALLDAINLTKGQSAQSNTVGSSASNSSSNNGSSNLPMVNHSNWVNPFNNIGAMSPSGNSGSNSGGNMMWGAPAIDPTPDVSGGAAAGMEGWSNFINL